MFKLEIADGKSIADLHSLSLEPFLNSTKIVSLQKRSTTLKIGTIPITVAKDFEQTLRYISTGNLKLFLSRSQSSSSPSKDLVVLGVPSEMNEGQFLSFLSASVRNISQIIRIEHSLVILRFISPNEAAKFRTEYNGIQFMANRPEYCQIGTLLEELPTCNDIRLPTCPLCMERLDASITGIPTSKCDHAENICKCMLKWKTNNNCPICLVLLDKSSARCNECNESVDNLWVCMTCASIGCGRYSKGHARQHYERNPSHAFAIDLEFQRIWNYASDNYVHRIIHFVSQNRIVDFPGPSVPSEFSHEFYSECEEKKVRKGNVCDERAQVEQIQAGIQSEKIRDLNVKCAELQKELDRLNNLELKYNEERLKCSILNEKLLNARTELSETIDRLRNENKNLNQIVAKQNSDLDGERALSERLVKEVSGLRKTILELEKSNSNLQEQVNDLMSHFEMQMRVGDEAKDGSLVIVEKKTTKGKKK